MAEKAKTPAIRFKGFTDAWEQRELSDVLVNRRILQRQTEDAPRRAFASGQGVIDLSERKTNNRDQLIADEFSKNYLLTEYDDIVYNPANLKYGAIDRNKLGKGVISPIYVTFTTEEIPSFVERIVTTERFKLKALRFEEGTVVKRQLVSPEKLLSFEEMIAPSKEEQKRIGDFFDYLDSLITLHQRKYNKLQNVKKAMLEKMFPKNGSNVPEIRFAGFTDAWEQRELGDLGDTFTGLSGKTKEDFGHGDGKFVTYMNVFSNPISDISATEAVEIDKNQNEIRYGDVFFTTSSETPEEVGMSSVWLGKSTNTYLNSFCFGYRPVEIIDPYYLAYMLRSPEIRNKISFLAQGISRYNISKNKVMEISVPTPELSEQVKVGQYFKGLDNLITLHQLKLDKLQNMKKACLEKMFI